MPRRPKGARPMTDTPSSPPTSPSTSRRALLAGALGGLGARVLGTSPSNGTGVYGASSSGFGVRASSTTSYAVYAASGSNTGVYASSVSASAVHGSSNAVDQPANLGWSSGSGNSTGLQGVSGASLPAAKAKTGVYGYAAQDSLSRGVTGESPAGIGLYGITSSGYAG